MSVLNNATLANPRTPYYALAGESASNWYNFPTLNGEIMMNDSTGTQLLQAIGGDLYFNNELLAKAGDLSNIADWSLYPQLSTLQGNNQPIVGVSDVQSSTLHTSTIFSLTAQMSTATLSGSINANTATIGSGLGSSVSISGGGITASGVISGSGLATTAGLNMTNTGITNTSAIGLSAAGLPPYGSLTSPDGTILTWNGAAITTGGGSSASNWSFYPQQSNLATFTATQISTASLGISSINGSAYVPVSQWASYYASGDVQLDGHTLFGGTNCNMNIVGQNGNTNLISQQSNVNIISQSGSVNISSYTSANVNATDVLIKAQTYSPINTPTVTVESRGGPSGGNVTLAAYAGNVPTEAAVGYGRVSLQAYGSSNATLNLGGLIDITAYSGSLPITLLTGTSALRMNAAAVNMSAGYVNALPSFAGSWTAYATNIASIVTGPIPSVFPQIPGTVYIYGFGAVRLDSAGPIQCLAPLETTFLQVDSITGSSSNVGTYFANPLTANVITPSPILGAVPGQDLYIRGSNAVIGPLNISTFIRLEDVRYCSFMTQGGAIGNLSSINNFTVTPDSLSGLSSLSISTINGYQFPQVAPAFSTISTYTDLYASEFHVSSIVALNSTIDIAAPVGVGLITAGDIANGGFLDINNQNTISTLNFAALGNDVGGTYLGGNTNSDFSYLWLNKDGAAGVELIAPRSNVLIAAESTINISSSTVNITTNNGIDMTTSTAVTFITPVVDIRGADLVDVKNINGDAGVAVTVNSSLDIALEAANDVYIEAQTGTATLNGNANVNINSSAGAITLNATSNVLIQTGQLNMNNNKIVSLGPGTTTTDAVNFNQLTFRDSTEFFVSAQGSNTNNGSILAPFLTIQAAITAAELISSAANICVINVASGHYVENLTFNKGYVVLTGSLQSQVGNEVCEITGSITINCTGANDVFNRQVSFQGFNLTMVGGQTITNTSASSHTVAFQDCKVYVDNVFYTSSATCPDARTYFTNMEITSVSALNVATVISTNVGLVELERIDMTVNGNAIGLAIGGTSVLNRCSLSTFDNTNGAVILKPLINITSSTTSTHSLGNVSFAFTSSVAKTNTNAMAIASSINTSILMFNCLFTLAGTASSTNNCIGYNGVGSPTIAGVNNTSLSVNVLLPQAVTVQSGIAQVSYIDINPPGLASYSSTNDQAISVAGTPQALTLNTTQFNQGTTLLSGSRVYANAQGNYQINYAIELTNIGSTSNLVTAFLKKNGSLIANTGIQTTVASGVQLPLTNQNIVALNAGDYVELWFSSAGNGTSANATAAVGAFPAIPSVLFNITAIR